MRLSCDVPRLQRRGSCRPPLRWLATAALGVLLLTGCRPPFALVEVVVDSEIDFDGTGTLRVGRVDSSNGQELAMTPDADSWTFAVTAREEGTHEIWAEIVDDGTVVARGHRGVVFNTQDKSAVPLLLTIPCTADEQCDDGVYCNGVGLCEEGHCVRSQPCVTQAECADLVCDEELRECLPEVRHDECNEGFADDDPQYCDPSQGCRPGLACEVPTDCADAVNCTGEFDCVNFRCVHLGPPALNDNNECTNDFCKIGEGVLHDPVPDGELCTAAEDGVCVSGACGTSRCGDGYVDAAVREGHPIAEECDDGDMFNSNTVPGACRENCVAAWCGDEVVDPGEECDDGNDDDTDGCKNDCTENRCGDGVMSSVEECDDGDDDNNDYCLRTCRLNVCGDGIVNFETEVCDDGNLNPNDGCFACSRTEWNISVPFGYGEGGGEPREVTIHAPLAVSSDNSGNIFWAEATSSVIRRFDVSSQKVSRVAGNGTFSSGGDGAPATETDASAVLSIAIDGVGNVIYSDSDGNRVRKIDARTGIVTTLAGTGEAGFSGDGQLGILAQLTLPEGVVVDGSGNVYFADVGNRRIRRIDAETGIITTVFGNGQENYGAADLPLGVEGVGVEASLWVSRFITLYENRYLFISDSEPDTIYRLDLQTGRYLRWAGDRNANGFPDGDAAINADLGGIASIAVGPDQSLYALQRNFYNAVIRIPPATVSGGIIEHIAFDGIDTGFVGDFWEDATHAEMSEATDLHAMADGTLLIADTGNGRIRAMRPSSTGSNWEVNTLVGNNFYEGIDLEEDNRALMERVFQVFPGKIGIGIPEDIGETPDIYLAGEAQHAVIMRPSEGDKVVFVAGTGAAGYTGDGGPATSATLNAPSGVAVDTYTVPGETSVYIVDRGNHVIRRVNADGTIETVVGTGVAGINTDEIILPPETTDAPLTIGGEHASGRDIHLNYPTNAGVDGYGRLWISDAYNQRMLRWDIATDKVDLINTPPNSLPWGVVVAPLNTFGQADGTLVIYVDRGRHQIAYIGEVDSGMGSLIPVKGTIAGSNSGSGYEDNANGLQAFFEYPRAVIPYIGTDCELCFLVADGFDRVRQLEVTLAGVLFTASVDTRLGGARPEGAGPFSTAFMKAPQHLIPIDENGALWLATDAVNGTLNLINFGAQPEPEVLVVAGFPEGFETGPTSELPAYTKKFHDAGQLVLVPPPEGSDGDPVLYVAEAGDHLIRQVVMPDPTQFSQWRVSPFAGQLRDAAHVDGSRTTARFNAPSGLAYDDENRVLYVAERGNHVVRAIDLQDPDGDAAVTTVVGTVGQLGFFGEGIAARDAILNAPSALAFRRGRLYIADTDNNRVRYVDNPLLPDATIHTLVGDGSPASGGSGPLARTFPVDNPEGIHVDEHGNAFITSRSALRRVAAGDDGLADGDDHTDILYGGGARDRYPEPITRCLSGVHTSLDSSRLYFFDACQGLMVQMQRERIQAD